MHTIIQQYSGTVVHPFDLLLIPLEKIRQAVTTHTVLNKKGGRAALNEESIRSRYGSWLYVYDLRSEYDVFVSYRWGQHDSSFSTASFDMFTNFTTGRENRGVEVFLDNKRLKDGQRFDKEFAKALLHSTIVMPVVSSAALSRMRDHNAAEIDNLLLEWILAIQCYKSPTTLTKAVYPITFGDRRMCENVPGDVISTDLFSCDVYQNLPAIVPTATLEFAMQLLAENSMSVDAHSVFKEQTVAQIVKELLKFQSLLTWQHDPSTVVEKAVKRVVDMLPELVPRRHDSAAMVSSPSRTQVGPVSTSTSAGLAQSDASDSVQDWLRTIIKGE